MKTFSFRGLDATGRAKKGLVEASDAKEAREKLLRGGVYVEHLADAQSSGGSRGRGLKLEERIAVFRQLAVLLRSGLPLAAALDVVIEAPDTGWDATLLAGIRDRLRGGSSFAAALAAEGDSLSSFQQAIVQAGERTGTLDVVLDQLAGYLEEQRELSDGIREAMLYPVMVVVLAVLVAVGMLGFVVPTLAKMFAESRIELPALTRAVIWISRHFWEFAAVLAVLVWTGVAWVRRNWRDPVRREAIEQRLVRLRWIGRGLRLMWGVRFARTMSLLLRGGVTLVEAMELAGQATGSRWIARSVSEQAERVRHGVAFSDALRAVPPMSGLLASWVKAGEASGSLDTLMHTAAERMQQQWKGFLQRITNLIGPVMILAVGGFVLLIALAILLPILSLTRGIQ